MKILHIAQMIKGGPASYLQEVAPYQIEELGRENVRVLVPEDERHFLSDLPTGSVLPLTVRRRTVGGLFRLAVQARKAIAAERPDVIHLHSSFAGAVVRLSYMFSGRRRPAIVYCSHGWAFNMQVPQYKRRLYAWIERMLARRTDAIVCISDFEHQEAVRRGFPPAKLHVIANGIAPAPPTVDVSAAPGFASDQLNVLFVGRQDRQKGFDVLLSAMRRLRTFPITLHVVGEAVVEHVSAEGNEPNVLRYGWRSRDEVAAFMRCADVLVMPSRWEGFGLVAVEAMREQLPVCASAVDALPELVREGVSGHLFPQENSQALAELLRSLDKRSLAAMGPRAREWFLSNFTADKMNRSIVDLYQQLLAPDKIAIRKQAETDPKAEPTLPPGSPVGQTR